MNVHTLTLVESAGDNELDGYEYLKYLLTELSSNYYLENSAGLAVRDGANGTKIAKTKGRLKALSEKNDHGHALAGIMAN